MHTYIDAYHGKNENQMSMFDHRKDHCLFVFVNDERLICPSERRLQLTVIMCVLVCLALLAPAHHGRHVDLREIQYREGWGT